MFFYIWLVTIIAALWLYFREVYSRFSRYGVKHFTPIPPLGTMARILFRLDHMADDFKKLYNAFPEERFVGRFEFLNPMVVVRDIELIKTITIKEFESFLDHRSIVNENSDPFFGRNLFSLKGEEWKDMRSTLSPAFTSSKMRGMVPFMMEAGVQMIEALKKQLDDSKTFHGFSEGCRIHLVTERGTQLVPETCNLRMDTMDIDCKDLTSRYANDVIASCAFGLKINSQTDTNNEFFKMGQLTASSFNFKQMLTLFALANFPKLASKLKLELFREETKTFFKSIVKSTMRDREANNIIRPDMIHLLMEAKKGKLVHDEKNMKDTDAGFATVEESVIGKKKIDRVWAEEDLIAQAILFFIAGFEGISSAMSFTLHELAVSPECQDKLAKEIRENNLKNGGKFDYNSIQNMKYMDMVVSEVLRLWPAAIFLDRTCNRDYNLGKPNKNATEDFYIRKGEVILIPVWAIHHDPQYYPNPTKFDPERFSDENKHKIHPLTYMPFGFGPRNCIGSRFALCEVKVMLYQLLLHMEVLPNEKTSIPARLSTETFNLRMHGGHWLRLRKRK